jgi:hypothetical protein
LHLVGFLFNVNYDARNHELKKLLCTCYTISGPLQWAHIFYSLVSPYSLYSRQPQQCIGLLGYDTVEFGTLTRNYKYGGGFCCLHFQVTRVMISP